MSKGTGTPRKPRSRLLALEPRVLFDGAVVDAAAAATQPLDVHAGDATASVLAAALQQTIAERAAAPAEGLAVGSSGAAPQPLEWLVVDASVPAAEQLLANARDGMRVLVLDAGRDGLSQIQEALAASGAPASALHIVSHGAPGYITLGSTQLDRSGLAARSTDLRALQAHLAAGADLLLYGCDVAATPAGEAFVQELAAATGADVAASTDATGGGAMGGDWVFEYATGSIEAAPFLTQQNGEAYAARLATVSLTGSAGWTPLLYGTRQDPAGDMQAAAASTDIVGDGQHATLYYAYDDGGTAGESDDQLLFRFRVSGPNSAGAFGAFGIVGMDADLNGDIDLYLIANDGNSPTLGLFNPGTDLNNAPSTTSYTPAGRSWALTSSNYAFTAVSSSSDTDWDGNGDIDGSGKSDYFVSFKISFAELKGELAETNIAGNPAAGIPVTRFSPMRFLLATATQSNSLNGDIGGIVGANSSTLTWEQLGAFSPVVSASNSPPIITSGGGGQTASYTVGEAQGDIATVAARDTDASDTLRYSIAGGADAAKFSIDPVTGVLSFASGFTPSASSPADSDGDGRYQVTVGVRDYADSGAVTAKGGSDTQDLTVTVVPQPDTTRPTLDLRTGITPADNATGVAPSANLFLRFSEDIQAASGNLTIRNATTGAIVQTISVTDTDQVRFWGSTVTVNPVLDLAAGTAYYLEIDPGAFQDLAGNTFVALDGAGNPLLAGGAPAGVNDTDPNTTYKWNFTTGSNKLSDSAPPTLVSTAVTSNTGAALSPADNQTGVRVTTDIVLTFSEAVFPDSGYFTIRRSSDGAVVARIGSADFTQVSYSADGRTVTLNPAVDLVQNTDYNVQVEGSALQDASGNRYAGITELNQGTTSAYALNFRTGIDASAPTVTLVSASNLNGTWIEGDTLFVRVMFSEQVVVTGTPQIDLFPGTTRTATYVRGSGSDTLIFAYTVQPGDTTADLDYQATNALRLNGGTIRDAAGNAADTTLPVTGSATALAGQKDLAIDAAPVNTLPALLNARNNTPLVFNAGVADVDSAVLTVRLTATYGTLTLGSVAGLTFLSGTGGGDASVAFSGTQAQINAALTGLAFQADAGYVGPASVVMETTDGATSVSGVVVKDSDTLTIEVAGPVPALGGTGAVGYLENDPASALAPVLTVSGTGTITGATIRISANYQPGEDLLEFSPAGGITVQAWDAATGTLTLTGTASAAAWQAALRSVTYRNTSETPSPLARTVTFIASNGADSSDAATVALNVTPIDDAPTLAATAASATFNQGGPAVNLFGAAAVSTIETGQSLTQLVLTVANVRNGAAEVLTIAGQGIALAAGSTTIGGVTYAVTVSGTSATVTVSGLNLDPAQAQALVEGIQYGNTAPAPTAGNRTVTITQLQDSGSNSAPDRNTATLALAATVRVVTDNAPPVLGGGSAAAAYVENGGGTALHPALTLADVDNGTLQGATVAIKGNFVAGQDLLAFTNQNGIIGSYDAATGVLTLSGTASVANYQAALRSVSYRNASEAPDTSLRTITWTASDGTDISDPLTSSVGVTAVNDAPTGADRTITVLQGASHALTAADFGFSDPVDGGADAFDAVMVVTGPGSGTLTLNGVAVADGTFVTAAQLAASQLLYTPSATTTASFTFRVRDDGGIADGGVAVDLAARTLTLEVSSANVAPALGGTGSAAYTEDGAAAVIGPALTITDADSPNLNGALVRITGGFEAGQDLLSFSGQNGITGTYNAATGVLTLSGSATRAQYEAALRTITFSSSSQDPSTAARSIEWRVSDGVEFSLAATSTVTVAAVNDAPVLSGPATSLGYTEGEAAKVVNGSLFVGDVDSTTLATATVRITANLAGNDRLAFTNDGLTMGNIAGSYDSATGVLSLASAGGSATVAQWQAALRAVTYSNLAAPGTATRTIEYRVNDGAADSNLLSTSTVTTFLANTAPTLAGGRAITYTENDPATVVDNTLAITDNGGTLAGAVVRITNFIPGQDVLAFTDQSGITGSFDASTGVLTLSGTATVGQYQAALRTITYRNSSDSPSGGVRNVSFQVNDGQGIDNLSPETATAITVTPVNDVPTTADQAVFAGVGNNVSYTFSLAEFTFSDLDSGMAGVVVTTLPAGGEIRVNGSVVAAGAFVSASDIALGRLTYANTNGNATARTFTFQVRDDSGSATNTSVASTMTVNVGTAGTRPTWTGSVTAKTYTENGAAVAVVDNTVSLSSATYTTARLTVTSGWAAGEDQLSFTQNAATMGAGAITVTNSGGVITLSRASGFTAAQMTAAVQAIGYSNGSDNPNTGTRSFSVQALANTAGSSWSLGLSGTVAVTPVNDTPTLASTTSTLGYTPGVTSAINPWIRITDLDGGLADIVAGNTTTATVTLANPQSGDVLGFSANAATMGNIALSSNAGGVLTLNSAGGTATTAQWEAALRAVSFSNASGANPTPRTVDFVVNDGTASSAALTTTIGFGNSSTSAPVLAVPATLSYTENGAAAAIDPALTISDSDSTNLAEATVRITNFVAGQDVLSFSDQNGITGSFDGATGVLTLTGTATVANYQAALRSVLYANTSDRPDISTRSVVYQVADGSAYGNLSNQLASTITVAAANDTPTLSTPSAITFNDNQFAQSFFAVTGTLTVSDADGSGASYGLTGSSAAGAGAPDGYDRQLAGSYGTLYLDSQTGAYSYVPDNAAINAVPAGSNPGESFSFTVGDGAGGSDTRTLTVNIVGANDTPILASGSTVVGYVENAAPVAVNTTLQVSDADSATLASASAAITGNYRSGQDLLSFTNDSAVAYGNIGASFDAATGVLSLSSAGGTATVAQWQAALRAVKYSNGSEAPDTAVRTVRFQVDDGGSNGASNALQNSTITLVSVDDAPALANPGSVAYGEQGAPVAISTGLTVADVDSASLTAATVWIANYVAGQDVLAFTDQGGITGSFDAATGVLTLSGSAGVAAYQAALRSITYANGSDDPVTTARSVRYQVSDGSSPSNTLTSTISLTAVNDAPVLGGGGATLTYTENGAAAAIDGTPTVSDVDSTGLASATVTISGGYVAGEDLLSFANDGTMGNIAASFDSASGRLTLTSSGGTATAAEWQAALRAVAYRNGSDAPTAAMRTVSYEISDGALASNTLATTTIAVVPVNDAPVLGGVATTVAYGENGAGVVLNSALTVADADHLVLTGATVTITGNFAAGEDLLEFTAQNGITAASYAGGVLTLTGTATVADYQAALRSVTYRNTSDNPSTAARSIAFRVSDGVDPSNAGSATVTVSRLNDAPTLAPSGPAVQILEDAPAPVAGSVTGAIAVASLVAGQADSDGAGALQGIAVTGLSGASGTWWSSIDGGASWQQVASAPSGASALLLAADGNAFLYFQPAGDFNGTVGGAVSFRAWDRTAGSNGGRFDTNVNGGSSAFSSAGDTVDVTVQPVNDAPVGSGSTLWTGKNTPRVLTAADFGFSDTLDAPADGLQAVKITGLPAAGTGALERFDGSGWVAVAQDEFVSAATVAAGALRYNPAAGETGLGLANIRFRVQDSGGTADGGVDLDTTERAILFNVGSQVPPALSGGGVLDYAETNPPVAQVVNANISVFDADNATLESGQVVISRGYSQGEDVLAFANTDASLYGDITATWDDANGVLALASAGAATQAQWQAAFRAVTYVNLSDAPSRADRSVSFSVNDGTQDSNVVAATITLDVQNDAPVVTASGAVLAYVENQPATAIDAGLVLVDPDLPASFDGGWLEVRITANGAGGEDILSVLDQGSGAGQIGVIGSTVTYGGVVIGSIDSASNGSGGQPLRIQLNADATADATQALARAIAYRNTSDLPSTASRTVVFTLDDGGNTGTGGRLQASSAGITITVASVNDAPVGSDGALSLKQGTALVLSAAHFGFSDPVEGDAFAGVLVTSLPGGGVLELQASPGNWQAVAANDFVLAADIAAGNLRYGAGGVPAASAFTFRVRDDGGTANAGADTDLADRTLAINVTAGDPPVIGGIAPRSVTENDAPLAVAPALTVSDADTANLQQATVSISGNYVPGQDLLAFTDMAGITGSFDAATGVLTLTGSAPQADWQAALRSVTYVNTSDAPSTATRTVSIVVEDAEATPNSSSRANVSITVAARNDAPVLAATPGLALTAVAEDAGAPIGAVGTLVSALGAGQSDADGPGALQGIAITGMDTGQGTWYYSTNNGLSWSQVGSSPSDSAALLLAADGNTRLYFQPAADFSGTVAAALSFRAWDRTSGSNGGTADASGANNGGTTAFSSAADSASITVLAVNDAPAGTDGTLTLLVGASHTFAAADFGFTDVRDGDALLEVQVTSVPASGTLTLDGVTITTATLASPVTVSAADLAAGKLVYTAGAGAATAALNFVVRDDGGTANGGVDADVFERSITLSTTSSFPPVLANGGTLAYTENQAPAAVSPALTLGDADSASMAGATVAIGAGYVPGEDVLSFTAGGGISGSFDAATGVLTLTGTASQAAYEAALRSVTYANGSEYPTTAARTVNYSVTDPAGNTSATLAASVTVAPVNDAPVAAPLAITVGEGASGSGSLPAASDAEGDTVVYAKDSDPASGTVTVNADGTYTYTPAGDFNGSDSFRYTVSDGKGGSNTYTVSVTVTGVNDAPVAAPLAITTGEDTAKSGSLPAATDADGDAVTYSKAGDPANGTVVVNADGTYTYTPGANFNGNDSFGYTVSDGNGGSNTYTVSVTVTAANDAPVAAVLAITMAEDSASSGSLPAASDLEGDAVAYAKASDPANGTVTVNADGTYTYTPAGHFNGSDSFSYTVDDGNGGSNTYAVTVTVTPVNDAPVAAALAVTTAEDTARSGNLPAAADADGDAVTYAKASDPANGTVVVNADGTYTYTPTGNFNGADSFTYTVSDGNGGSNIYTVSVTVTPVNDAPVAAALAITTSEGTPRSGSLPVASDADGDAAVYAKDSDPANGTVLVNADGTYTYTPTGNFNGADSFTYTVSDGNGGSNTYGVTVTVDPANDAPVAAPLAITTAEDSAKSGNLPAAADADGDAVVYAKASDPANGTVVVNADGTYTYTPAADFNGSDSFGYTVSDGNGGSNTYTVTVTVTAVNDAPLAAPLAITTAEDTASSGSLPAASDPEGDAVTYAKASDPANGMVVVNADGTYTYTPGANFNGSDSFNYTVSDGNGGSATYAVSVTVSAVNDAPVAASLSVSITTSEDTSKSGSLPLVADAEGDVVTYAKATDPASGTATVNPDGTYTYTPDPDFNGADSFDYTVSDGNGGSNTYTVTVLVNPVNDAPEAASLVIATAEDTASSGSLPPATDVEGDAVTYAKASDPANGTVTVNADGTYTYTPHANFTGADSFNYTVSDGNGGSNTYGVSVTVGPANDAPVAAPLAITTGEDTPRSGNLPAAADAEGDAVTYAKASDPSNGTAVVNADGTYTYTPGANFNGGDSFTYTVSDGNGGSNTYTVSVTVSAVNDAPVAAPLAITTPEDSAVSGSLPAASDVEGDAVTYAKASDPANGTVTVNADGTYTYTPADNFNGSDSFSYTVGDGSGGGNTYTVSVTVTPVNDAPVAAAASITTAEDTARSGSLPAATDPEGDAVSYAKASDPVNGAVVVNADGTYTYTPAGNFNGTDSFTYTVSDGNGGSSTHTVSVTVTAVNDAPVAAALAIATAEDTAASGSLPAAADADGDAVVYAKASDPANGTVVVNADGTYTYAPATHFNGSDSFSYTVDDGNGGSNTYAVTVTVTPVNDAPVAAALAITTAEDTAKSGSLPAAADADGDAVAYAKASDPADGTVVVNADGTYTYTPGANFNGSDTFGYTVSDGNGGSNTYTVSVTVTAINDAPVAAALAITTAEDTARSGSLPAATDADGDAVVYAKATNPANGTLVVNADGTYIYTPGPNFNGSDSFTYTVSDGNGGSNTYTVSVTVTAANDAPVASPLSITTAEDTSSSGSLPAATDAEGDAVVYAKASDPTNGSVVVNADGTYSYTPGANFNGSDSFSYSVSDGNGGSNTYTVSVTVTAVNDAPVAAALAITTAEDTSRSGSLPAASDFEGDAVTYAKASDPAGGTVTVNADGTYTYTPAGNFNGSDSFTYTVSDGSGGSNTYTVSVTVTAANDAPVAAALSITTAEDTASSGSLPAASDVEADAITYAKASDPVNGTAVVNADGTYTYTPTANFNGTDSFTYTVSDSNGGSNTYAVSVTVTAVNDAPVAAPLAITTAEDTSRSGNLPAASDVEGDGVTYAKAGDPANGTVVVNVDGTYTYTPGGNFNGSDSFTYTVTDGNGGSNTYTVSVTVTAVNDAPIAAPLAITTAEDTPRSGSLPAVTDADGDAVTYAKASDPANGTVVVNADGTFTYTPSGNFNGTDSFTYTVSDGNGGSSTYTVGVTVTAVNDAPVAAALAITTAEDTPRSGSLPVATDADGDAVVYARATNPANGSVVVNADGTYGYTPTANFNGADSFTYTVSDSNGGSNSYTVSVTVTAVNDAPIAAPLAITTAEDTPRSGSLPPAGDADGDAVVYAKAGDPANGTVVVNADGTYTYTPNADFNGSDGFSYSIGDGNGGSNTYAVSITVTAVDGAATFAGNLTGTGGEDTPISGALTASDPADGMSGPNYTLVVAPGNGTVSIDPATGSWRYVPAADYNGGDSFTVSVTDDQGNVATQVITLAVTAVNDAPRGSGGSMDTRESTPAGGRLPAATDVDGDPVGYGVATGPAHGSLVLNPDGSYTYTPAPGYSGDDSFTYTISDGAASTTYAMAVRVLPAEVPLPVLPTPAIPAPVIVVPAIPTPAIPALSEAQLPAPLPALPVDSGAAPARPATVESPMLGSMPFIMPSLADLNVLSTSPSDYALVRLNVANPVRVAMLGPAPDILESIDRGFPALRGSVPRQEGAMTAVEGVSLSVFHGVPDIAIDDGLDFTVPRDAFIHTDPRAVIKLEARQVDGRPLPAWIRFDGITGLFHGRRGPGDPLPQQDVELVARDNAGRAARTTFTIADAEQLEAARLASTDRGFPVTRLSHAQLSIAPGSGGDLLVPYVPIGDANHRAGQGLGFRIPGDAFAHTNPRAVVRLAATLANGDPLPAWMHFDGTTGALSGTPPEDFAATLEIRVTARDDQGLQAVTRFKLTVVRSAIRTAGGEERAALEPADSGHSELERAAEVVALAARGTDAVDGKTGPERPQAKRAAPSFAEQLRQVRQPGADQALVSRALHTRTNGDPGAKSHRGAGLPRV